MKTWVLLLAVIITGCTTHTVSIPTGGSPPPPIRYCKPGEAIGCKQFGAADNGAVTRGHSEEQDEDSR